MADSLAIMIGTIIGALFAGVGSALLNFHWCGTIHKRPILGYFAAGTAFLCGLTGGFILAALPTLILGSCAWIFSKKARASELAPVVPLPVDSPQPDEKIAS